MSTELLETTIHIENILNLYSGKRYHIKTNCQREDSLLYLIQVVSFGKEKIIIDKLPQKEFLEKLFVLLEEIKK